jgi:hypothetical protein
MHLDSLSCTTLSCSNLQKRRTSWSGVRPRALAPPGHTSPKPRKNTPSCTRLYMLQGRCVLCYEYSLVTLTHARPHRMAGNTSASSVGTWLTSGRYGTPSSFRYFFFFLVLLCRAPEADVRQAQRALAARRSQDADIAEIARGLKKGQLEQLTVELQQVSLLGPNAAESAVMRKLRD